MQLKTIHDIQMGDKASFSKTVSESDVYLFAGITGDVNPAHVDAEYAKGTFFKHRVAHGVLSMGFISTVLGMYLPGPGTILLKIEARFTSPVYFGDTVTTEAEVIEKDLDKNRVRVKTVCRNQEGKIVVDGEALVSPYVKK